jgi:DNA-binding GntR family transcriptional regulator
MSPLNLKPLDLTSGVPKSTQIANAVRQAIATRDVLPGEEILTEHEIAKMAGCNRSTVQRAMKELADEGRIITERGRPNRVAPSPDQRRVDASRYGKVMDLLEAGGPRPRTSAFADDYGVTLDDVTFECEYSIEPATQLDAMYLGIKVGQQVLRRRTRKLVRGEAKQIQRDAIPAKFAKGTLLEDPSIQPYPLGLLAELFDVGLVYRPLHVREIISGAPPNGEERRLLQVRSKAAVWTPVRVLGNENGPVAVTRAVYPMPGNEMVFDFWIN